MSVPTARGSANPNPRRFRSDVWTLALVCLLSAAGLVAAANANRFETLLQVCDGACPTASFATAKGELQVEGDAEIGGNFYGVSFSPTASVFLKKGTDVASAASLAIGAGQVFHVTGTTTITSVTDPQAGRVVYLIFDGALTFTDGGNLKLAGNLTTTADDTIVLVGDGTSWFEVARSVN